jgi:hypothetical protein
MAPFLDNRFLSRHSELATPRRGIFDGHCESGDTASIRNEPATQRGRALAPPHSRFERLTK